MSRHRIYSDVGTFWTGHSVFTFKDDLIVAVIKYRANGLQSNWKERLTFAHDPLAYNVCPLKGEQL